MFNSEKVRCYSMYFSNFISGYCTCNVFSILVMDGCLLITACFQGLSAVTFPPLPATVAFVCKGEVSPAEIIPHPIETPSWSLQGRMQMQLEATDAMQMRLRGQRKWKYLQGGLWSALWVVVLFLLWCLFSAWISFQELSNYIAIQPTIVNANELVDKHQVRSVSKIVITVFKIMDKWRWLWSTSGHLPEMN